VVNLALRLLRGLKFPLNFRCGKVDQQVINGSVAFTRSNVLNAWISPYRNQVKCLRICAQDYHECFYHPLHIIRDDASSVPVACLGDDREKLLISFHMFYG
jgi:hypothetical protein